MNSDHPHVYQCSSPQHTPQWHTYHNLLLIPDNKGHTGRVSIVPGISNCRKMSSIHLFLLGMSNDIWSHNHLYDVIITKASFTHYTLIKTMTLSNLYVEIRSFMQCNNDSYMQCPKTENVIILMTFLSLTAPDVVSLNISGAACDKNFIKMTFPFLI